MEKRKVIFGTYDTALEGAWTVAKLELTSPDVQTNLVQIPGRNGPLDLSDVLTGGEPVYEGRKLTVVLETSDGTRLEREQRIRKIIADLDGRRVPIWLPDSPGYYLEGRLHLVREYNDLAHAAVTATATCDPWLYSDVEIVYSLTATAEAQTAGLVNSSRRTAVPVVVVTGGPVDLDYGTYSWTLSAGTYQLPDFVVPTGEQLLTYSGTGTVKISYREAVLL